MIQVIFSASGEKHSFTIVSFASCERGSDITFDASFTCLGGIMSKEISFCVKFIDDFLNKCGIL